MAIFDQRYEQIPREELRQLQFERLQALLNRLRKSVRRYRELLGETRVDSLDALANIPTTTPEDVSNGFPYGLFALPLREVIRLHSIMGPKGKPLVISHTRNDLLQWGRLAARQLVALGVTANDILQIALGGAQHLGAAGYGLGAELIQASIIAEDPLHIDSQLGMLESYRPTVLITTPRNAFRLAEEMECRRMEPQSLSLRTVLLTRPVDADTRERLRAALFAEVKCNFGIGEILDPGFCVECEEGRFHANEDHFLVEAVDGELVVTTLCREALPLVRYRTRIACEIHHEKCPCGRIGAVLVPGQRLDERLMIAETPIYEYQIADVLKQRGVSDPNVAFRAFVNHIEIEIPVTSALFGDTIRTIERLRAAIQNEFQTRYGIEARVQFRESRTGAVDTTPIPRLALDASEDDKG